MKTLFPNDAEAACEASDKDQFKQPPQASSAENSVWEQIKLGLRDILSTEAMESWILPIKATTPSNEELLLIVPDMLFYQIVVNDYLDKLERVKASLGFDHIAFKLHLAGQKQTNPTPQPSQSQSLELGDSVPKLDLDEIKLCEKSQPTFSKTLTKNSKLNSNYTFTSFVRGPSNQFALATCLNVAETPGANYNPLFIYGSTGLGKTHLMHAVGNHVATSNPRAIVTYISSERFMNEMIHCIRHNKMWEFRQKYRHCDVFMMDDIQFISGNKAATQEEFFHTFNTLYEAKKQIIITSDLFPQDIPDIEERLRNRFQWGLIADIQPPDIEHRIAILMNKSERLGVHLSYEVAEYIASHAKRNIRELEGALHRIAAFAALQGRPVDKTLATETFQSVMGEPPKKLTIETIQKVVSEHFKVRTADLKSKKRQRALTMPRQIAMYLSRSHTNSSFPEIGERFGGKDHSTVIHAVKKIDKERPTDPDLRAHLEVLERSIEQIS